MSWLNWNRRRDMLTNHRLMSFEKFFFWRKSRNLSDRYNCPYVTRLIYPDLSEIVYNCPRVSAIVQNVLKMCHCSRHRTECLFEAVGNLGHIFSDHLFWCVDPISKIDQNCPNLSRIVQTCLKLSKSGWGYCPRVFWSSVLAWLNWNRLRDM